MKYHAEFEKQKGKVTQVADDPETLRLRQNTKNISNVAYHGDLQKKAAMEKQREFGEVVDNKGMCMRKNHVLCDFLFDFLTFFMLNNAKNEEF